MEISLKFRDERVTETASWTNGCAYSLNCICAVADLAKGKTPDEILEFSTTKNLTCCYHARFLVS
jgi:NifU-like protein involved in Fe-S cluster formation